MVRENRDGKVIRENTVKDSLNFARWGEEFLSLDPSRLLFSCLYTSVEAMKYFARSALVIFFPAAQSIEEKVANFRTS